MLALRATLAAALLPVCAFCTAQAPSLDQTNRKWAVVVGVSQYPNLGNLDFSSRDAEQFASTLESSCGFDKQGVSLLADGISGGQQPTAANILAALSEKIDHSDLDKNDLFIFYFSGHGIEYNGKDYLLPGDVRHETIETVGLNIQDVIDEMKKARLRNAILVIDACRETPDNSFGAETLHIAKQSRIAVLLSCKPGEQSYERPDLQAGLFTASLINLLKGDSCVDASTGALWTSDLAKPLQGKVEETAKKYGLDQNPTALLNEGQDIVLTVRQATDATANAFEKRNSQLSQDQQIANVLTLAESMFEKGDYQTACKTLQSCEQVAIKDPKFAYAYAGVALNLNLQGLYQHVCSVAVEDDVPSYYGDSLRLMLAGERLTFKDYGAAFHRMIARRTDLGLTLVGLIQASYPAEQRLTLLHDCESTVDDPEKRKLFQWTAEAIQENGNDACEEILSDLKGKSNASNDEIVLLQEIASLANGKLGDPKSQRVAMHVFDYVVDHNSFSERWLISLFNLDWTDLAPQVRKLVLEDKIGPSDIVLILFPCLNASDSTFLAWLDEATNKRVRSTWEGAVIGILSHPLPEDKAIFDSGVRDPSESSERLRTLTSVYFILDGRNGDPAKQGSIDGFGNYITDLTFDALRGRATDPYLMPNACHLALHIHRYTELAEILESKATTLLTSSTDAATLDEAYEVAIWAGNDSLQNLIRKAAGDGPIQREFLLDDAIGAFAMGNDDRVKATLNKLDSSDANKQSPFPVGAFQNDIYSACLNVLQAFESDAKSAPDEGFHFTKITSLAQAVGAATATLDKPYTVQSVYWINKGLPDAYRAWKIAYPREADDVYQIYTMSAMFAETAKDPNSIIAKEFAKHFASGEGSFIGALNPYASYSLAGDDLTLDSKSSLTVTISKEGTVTGTLSCGNNNWSLVGSYRDGLISGKAQRAGADTMDFAGFTQKCIFSKTQSVVYGCALSLYTDRQKRAWFYGAMQPATK